MREVIEFMGDGGFITRTRPLRQFIADWNSMPHHRSAMLAGDPPEDADEFLRAATASVVHSLCERDSIEVPSWVRNEKLEEERTISGRRVCDSAFAQTVKRKAPS